MRYLLILCIVFKFLSLEAQDQLDSLVLEDIKVFGTPISKYAAGAKIESIKSNQNSTLDQAISDNSSIYFKTYGNGQLSTISFRGTSASHTSVLWNGIPANSPTLGQTDFSLWPVFLLDDIAIQSGSASSLYGSGAIGGAVLLESSENYDRDTTHLELLLQSGSFGQWKTGVKTNYGNKNLNGQTKLYYSFIENDFEYKLKGTDKTQKQNNASVLQYGVAQDLIYNIGIDKTVIFNGIGTFNLRETQPPISNNASENELEDSNLRLAVSYYQEVGTHKLNSTIAYLLSDQYYNGGSRVKSDQYSALIGFETTLSNNISIRLGSNFNYFSAVTDGYSKTEGRLDFYSSLNYQPFSRWNLSLNLRQTFNESKKPFTPSFGQELKLIKSDNQQLIFHSQIGRSYRLPTLNDRYWQPGGNPNLNSEIGISTDAGLKWKNENGAIENFIDVTVHKSWIDQWIIWLPNNDGVWSPMNIKEVEVTGLELSTFVKWKPSFGAFKLGGSYAYTASINKSGLNESEVANKQLPYVPKHRFQVSLQYAKNDWSLNLGNQFTGLRYTTDDNASFGSIDAFNLLNLEISKSFILNKAVFRITGQVRNISNEYYENLLNHAMPGRNFNIKLNLKL